MFLARVEANPGFWGVAVTSPLSSVQRLEFIRCPAGYCLTSSELWSNTCAEDRTGRLCGTCRPHFSQSVGSAKCVKTSSCVDYRWFVPLVVFAGFCYVAYIHLCARYTNGSATLQILVQTQQRLPVILTDSLSVLQVLFLQVCPLLVVQPAPLISLVLSSVSLNLKATGEGGYAVCPFPGLTTYGSLFLGYASVGVLALQMVIVQRCKCAQSKPAEDGMDYASLNSLQPLNNTSNRSRAWCLLVLLSFQVLVRVSHRQLRWLVRRLTCFLFWHRTRSQFCIAYPYRTQQAWSSLQRVRWSAIDLFKYVCSCCWHCWPWRLLQSG